MHGSVHNSGLNHQDDQDCAQDCGTQVQQGKTGEKGRQRKGHGRTLWEQWFWRYKGDVKVTPSSGPQSPAPSSAISRTGRTTAQARRIALNVLLDGVVSAAAAPVARWLADPHGGLLHPLWFVAGGGITLLVSGLPFRMAQQYWRFSGLSDLFNIACASVVSATLFSTLLHLAGYPLPSTTFPVIHALVLLTCLGALRMFWRLTARRRLMVAERERVLLLGADHEADLFIRAMERDHQAGRRVVGLLTGERSRQGDAFTVVPFLERLMKRLKF